ncbi:MRC1 [Branchiostoma lanceolatum]|uniref:MRC1 protein n=1 Tax=Branchiostoma lanceolatum TaxID=7740 RepID=A0A8J9YLG0_BRALA|nr:MRC1 [Branchiostoma lanceolatum]
MSLPRALPPKTYNMSRLLVAYITIFAAIWMTTYGMPTNTARCPEGYTDGRFAELCFRLVRTPLSYTKAAATCGSDGGKLITDKNRAKHNYLLKRDFAMSYWVGLDDLKEENTFVWSDGEVLGDFAIFSESYPHQQNADCVVLSRLTNMEWVPSDCEQTFAFVCQKELIW